LNKLAVLIAVQLINLGNSLGTSNKKQIYHFLPEFAKMTGIILLQEHLV